MARVGLLETFRYPDDGLHRGAWRLRGSGVRGAKTVRVADHQSTPPTVYFYLLDNDAPFGGTRTIYRHIEMMRRSGLSAVALHQKRGFRFTWFDHQVPTDSVSNVAIGPDDLLVVPEPFVPVIARGPAVPRHVVLNQNPFLTWGEQPAAVSRHYFSDRRPLAIISTSAFTTEFVHFCFPRIEVHEVRPTLDPAIFRPGDGERPKRIAYMPRKGARADAEILLRMFEDRGTLRDWEIRPLDGLREERVAAELRSARIFLALSTREGLGLPPLEAMASGCYVVGYHAIGGREYMRPEFCSAVEPGDITGLAQELERVIRLESNQPGWLREHGQQASRFAREQYSPECEQSAVVRIYSDLLTRRDLTRRDPS